MEVTKLRRHYLSIVAVQDSRSLLNIQHEGAKHAAATQAVEAAEAARPGTVITTTSHARRSCSSQLSMNSSAMRGCGRRPGQSIHLLYLQVLITFDVLRSLGFEYLHDPHMSNILIKVACII